MFAVCYQFLIITLQRVDNMVVGFMLLNNS